MKEYQDKKSSIYKMSMIAVMTAVTCVLAPMSIPVGTVPISFTNLAIYLSLYLLGWKFGTISYVMYMLIGMIGVPVFSGFSGGLGKLLGPTGGYIFGFIPMAIIAGLVIEKTKNRFLHFAGLVAGTAVAYALGTAWYCVVMNSGVVAALIAHHDVLGSGKQVHHTSLTFVAPVDSYNRCKHIFSCYNNI